MGGAVPHVMCEFSPPPDTEGIPEMTGWGHDDSI